MSASPLGDLYRLRRMVVHVLSPATGRYEKLGSVALRIYATEHEIERSLATLGVYAPRGFDVLLWTSKDGCHAARINDSHGKTIVRLEEWRKP